MSIKLGHIAQIAVKENARKNVFFEISLRKDLLKVLRNYNVGLVFSVEFREQLAFHTSDKWAVYRVCQCILSILQHSSESSVTF